MDPPGTAGVQLVEHIDRNHVLQVDIGAEHLVL